MFLPQIKKISLLMTVFAMVLFISCKDEKTNRPAASDSTTESVQNKADQTGANGNVALNPPHGQPGHRCEIPVGAPLDGSGGNNTPVIQAQPQSNQSPVIKNTGSVPVNGANTNTGTTGNVNPPHGQPGHKCEIPVGAPLD